MADSAGGTCAVLKGAFNKDSYFNPLCKYNSKSKDAADRDHIFTTKDDINKKYLGEKKQEGSGFNSFKGIFDAVYESKNGYFNRFCKGK